jgi:hypothetical protein
MIKDRERQRERRRRLPWIGYVGVGGVYDSDKKINRRSRCGSALDVQI